MKSLSHKEDIVRSEVTKYWFVCSASSPKYFRGEISRSLNWGGGLLPGVQWRTFRSTKCLRFLCFHYRGREFYRNLSRGSSYKEIKSHIGAYSFEENDNAFLSNVFFSIKCYFTFFNFLAHNIGNLTLFVVPWDEGRFTLGSLMYYVLTLFCIFQFLFGITHVWVFQHSIATFSNAHLQHFSACSNNHFPCTTSATVAQWCLHSTLIRVLCKSGALQPFSHL